MVHKYCNFAKCSSNALQVLVWYGFNCGSHSKMLKNTRICPKHPISEGGGYVLPVSFKSGWNIISNDRSFGRPIAGTDTFHNVILFIDTSTILDTTKLNV